MTPPDSPSSPNALSSSALRRRTRNRTAANRQQIASIENEIGDRLLERLSYIKHQPRTILNLGYGLARHSAALNQLYPSATIVALDDALDVLMLAPEQNLAKKIRGLFKTKPMAICADSIALPLAAQSMEMVWANLLNVAEDAQRIIAELKRVLKPGGLLMMSTVGPDTLKELRAAFATVDALPHVQSQIDMHDLGDLLVHEGFATPVVDMEMLTLTYPDVVTLAHDLRAAGDTCLDTNRRSTLTGKGRWQRITAAYESNRHDGQLPASVEVVYVHAWRGIERQTKDGRQIIRFEKT